MPQLTVIGAINLDLIARVGRAPGPGETVADGVLQRMPGGKGANQAVAAARLGGRVALVGAVGDDDDGRAMRAALAAAGVDVSGVQTVSSASGTALITVDASGENSIVVCAGANAEIDPRKIRIDPTDAILAQLEVADDVVETGIRLAEGLVVLNPSPARELSATAMDRVDLFIVNETERDQLPRIATAPLVAVTLGADGAVLLRHGREIARASGVRVAVRSTVGAGDAFAAALTLGILRGDDPGIALRRACAVGAAAVADDRSQPEFDHLDTYPEAS